MSFVPNLDMFELSIKFNWFTFVLFLVFLPRSGHEGVLKVSFKLLGMHSWIWIWIKLDLDWV